jgi:protein XRP2
MTTITKKKLNKADYMFKDRTGEELVKKPGEINGIDFMIRSLTDCTVYIMDHTAQVSYRFISENP